MSVVHSMVAALTLVPIPWAATTARVRLGTASPLMAIHAKVCVSICMYHTAIIYCTHTHTHMHTHTHTDTHTDTDTHTYTRTHTLTQTQTHTQAHIHTQAHTYMLYTNLTSIQNEPAWFDGYLRMVIIHVCDVFSVFAFVIDKELLY